MTLRSDPFMCSTLCSAASSGRKPGRCTQEILELAGVEGLVGTEHERLHVVVVGVVMRMVAVLAVLVVVVMVVPVPVVVLVRPSGNSGRCRAWR